MAPDDVVGVMGLACLNLGSRFLGPGEERGRREPLMPGALFHGT